MPAPTEQHLARRAAICSATYRCVARWGMAKTTVEDAAREAGISRATMYRYFPGGRDELFSAVINYEYQRFFLELFEAIRDADSLEEVIERGILFARQAIVGHEVLQKILQTEPEAFLPKFSIEADGTNDVVARFLQSYLERHELAPGVDAAEAAEFLAAMVLSHISSPGRWDLNDPEQVARLVRYELLSGIVGPPVTATS